MTGGAHRNRSGAPGRRDLAAWASRAHVEALAEELIGQGRDAPHDPDDRWPAPSTAACGGVAVFGHRRLREWATVAQLTAWALQRLACYALLVALALDAKAGLGGAAVVLFAVNTAAPLPAFPPTSACSGGVRRRARSLWVGPAEGLAYGITLQGLELAPGVAFGPPAFVGEGLSSRQMRLRALGATPLDLSRRPEARPRAAG